MWATRIADNALAEIQRLSDLNGLRRSVKEAAALFGTEPAMVKQGKMFGELCFMLGGNMAFGIAGNDLMTQVGPDNFEETLALTHARPMDFTGRSIKGMVYVDPDGFKTDRARPSQRNRA